MNKEWLICTKTPDEFERDALKSKATAFGLPLDKVIAKFADRPFGTMTDKWRSFVKQMQVGDELWSFATSNEMFAAKMGASGYAIVRLGQVIDVFTMLRT